MSYDSLESETQVECEKLKAKAAIAVAVINNACGESIGIKNLSDAHKQEIIKFIKEAQQTLND